MKKFFSACLALLVATSLAGTAFADPKPGEDFDLVAQQIPTDNPAKIEVMEIFWYGCPHCYHMEAPLSAWIKKLPADVTFKHMPGLPRADWAPMAKAYFTMETLGVLPKLHGALFEAIHKQRTLNPTDEKATIAWITNKSGLDRVKVEQTYNSFAVNTNLNRAAQIFRASGATGVPSFVIDGKYITSASMAGGNEQALKVVDYIIANVRKDKAKAAKK